MLQHRKKVHFMPRQNSSFDSKVQIMVFCNKFTGAPWRSRGNTKIFFLFWNFYFILVFEATIKTNATFFLILSYCGLVIWRSSKPLLCWEIVGMAKPKFIKLFKRNFYTHIQLFYSNIRYCVTDDDEDQWIFRIPISLLHSIELNMTNWA